MLIFCSATIVLSIGKAPNTLMRNETVLWRSSLGIPGNNAGLSMKLP